MHKDVISIIRYAVTCHEGQKYGKHEYVYHLDHVYRTFDYLFGPPSDSETKVIYCHDIIEDTGETREDLMAAGLTVEEIDAVVLLTKCDRNTREQYILNLSSIQLPRRVKISDSTSNLIHSLRIGNQRLIDKYTDNLRLLWEAENKQGKNNGEI